MLNIDAHLELEARGAMPRPERVTGRNQPWRASQDFLQSWKVPSRNHWEGAGRRGKNPKARLCCRVLNNGGQ